MVQLQNRRFCGRFSLALTVRLVVFNPDQQLELFRQDDFKIEEIDRIVHAADGIDQWAVGYNAIQNPMGAWDLIADLEDKEMRSAVPPDDVVFLGLPWGLNEKLPPRSQATLPGKSPRYFYLEYRPYPPGTYAVGWVSQPRNAIIAGKMAVQMPTMPMNSGSPNGIEQSVQRLNGKTFSIYTPADLSKAIETIDRGPRR